MRWILLSSLALSGCAECTELDMYFKHYDATQGIIREDCARELTAGEKRKPWKRKNHDIECVTGGGKPTC